MLHHTLAPFTSANQKASLARIEAYRKNKRPCPDRLAQNSFM